MDGVRPGCQKEPCVVLLQYHFPLIIVSKKKTKKPEDSCNDVDAHDFYIRATLCIDFVLNS